MDITKLDGYRDDMTAEEKLELINGYEPPKPTHDGYVKKEVFDKTASELADYKKQLRAKSSEEEIKASEQLAAQKKLEEELATLKREKLLADHKATFLGLGYSEELATKAAVAYTDGDNSAFFEVAKAHHTDLETKQKEANLLSTPRPKSGEPKGSSEDNQLRAAFGLT